MYNRVVVHFLIFSNLLFNAPYFLLIWNFLICTDRQTDKQTNEGVGNSMWLIHVWTKINSNAVAALTVVPCLG